MEIGFDGIPIERLPEITIEILTKVNKKLQKMVDNGG